MSQSKMRLTVLVTTFIDAVTKDESPEENGFDLSAGIFGVHVSTWIRGLANEMDAMAGKLPTGRSTAPENQGLDTDNEVFFYERDFYVLSNFSAFNLKWKGHTFPTSEHAYHWEKFTEDQEIRRAIGTANSAHEAFKIAESFKSHRRSDWDDLTGTT